MRPISGGDPFRADMQKGACVEVTKKADVEQIGSSFRTKAKLRSTTENQTTIDHRVPQTMLFDKLFASRVSVQKCFPHVCVRC